MPRLEVVEGDITLQRVDAVVNAANTTLLGGGGVDGAIHRAAGPGLLEECRALGGCPTGEARLTRGHRLPAPWVIHTVGPVWSGGRRGEEALLASCWRRCLEIANERGFSTVAFPSISTGAYRFPLDLAARTAAKTCAGFLKNHSKPEKVVLVAFDARTAEAYRLAFAKVQVD